MKVPWAERNPPLRRISPSGPADHMDVGEYPLKQLRGNKSCEFKPLGRRAKTVLRWGQYFFLLVGLLGAGWYGFVYAEAKIYQTYQGWRLDRILKHQPASLKAYLADWLGRISTKLPNHEISKAPPVNLPVNPSTLEAPRGPSSEQPHPPLSEGSLIGRIEVPRIGLSAVVLEGDDDDVLRKAVGHIPGTALVGSSGNIGIAGHRDTFFRALRNVRKNDDVTLKTAEGVYHYRVSSVERIDPEDTQVLQSSSQPTLTLVTCYPFNFVGSAPRRFIVQARQIESSQAVEPGSLARSSTSAADLAPELRPASPAGLHALSSGLSRRPAESRHRARLASIRSKRSRHEQQVKTHPVAQEGAWRNLERSGDEADPGTTTLSAASQRYVPQPSSLERRSQIRKVWRRPVSWLRALRKRVAGEN